MPITKVPAIVKFVTQQVAKNIGKKRGIATILDATDPRITASVDQVTQTLKNIGVDVSKLKSPDSSSSTIFSRSFKDFSKFIFFFFSVIK